MTSTHAPSDNTATMDNDPYVSIQNDVKPIITIQPEVSVAVNEAGVPGAITLPADLGNLTVRSMIAEAIMAQHKQQLDPGLFGRSPNTHPIKCPSPGSPVPFVSQPMTISNGQPVQFIVTPATSGSMQLNSATSFPMFQALSQSTTALGGGTLPFVLGTLPEVTKSSFQESASEAHQAPPSNVVLMVPAGTTVNNEILQNIKQEAEKSKVKEIESEQQDLQDMLDSKGQECTEDPSVAEVTVFTGSPGSPFSDQEDIRSPGGTGRSGSKKMSSAGKNDDSKVCRVCGDKALGCNFDAISCESCKAFFRRNAIKDKHPKCMFEGQCKIDMNTRRFCPFCRLSKCFQVGMKKEFILGDNERKRRNEKVKTNRRKRQKGGKDTSANSSMVEEEECFSPAPDSVEAPSTPAGGPTTPTPTPTPTPTHIHNPAAVTAQVINVAQNAIPMMMESLPQPGGSGESPVPTAMEFTLATVESTNLLTLSKQARNNGDVTADNASLLAGATPTVASSAALAAAMTQPAPPLVDMYVQLMRKLTSEEQNMLQELNQVYDLSFTVDLEPLIHIKHLDPSLNQLVNQSSITVLRIIKFAKRLDEFVRLPQESQIGILKGTWIHILLLRSVSLYDTERDVWVTPRGDIPTEILKNATGFDQLHDDHVQYCKSIKSIIRDDLTIVSVLLVIVLFSPEGAHVINREIVSNIQDKYLVLLKHYLESKYTFVRASEMFPKLIFKMKELKELAEVHCKYLLDVNPSEIEPIMLEILDLK